MYSKSILKPIFHLLSHFPLVLLHAIGALLGLGAWLCSRVYRQRLHANARLAGYGWRTRLGAAAQAGMMITELPRLWLGRPVHVAWQNRPALDAVFAQAHSRDEGIIFLTPHLGSWEMAGQAIANACNAHGKTLTVMYKPAKQAALASIVKTSRQRPSLQTVPANASGVRQMLRALKTGGAIGLLPDQVPQSGMGVWSNVFNKPAYTMTLAAKLAQSHNCPVVMVWCERLWFGGGYQVYTQRLTLTLDTPLDDVVRQINVGIETAIRALPSQYLWGYARYKQPKDALQKSE